MPGNIDKVLEISDQIVSLCSEPVSFEQLLKKLFEAYDLRMTFEQHALVGSTEVCQLHEQDGKALPTWV